MYASLGRRLLAFALDWLILTIPMVIGGHLIPVLGGLIVWFFYAPMMDSSTARATLGKHLCGIQVTDPSGRRISLKAALIRNVMKIISMALLFIGFFFALFTTRKQALHDMLAETQVVYGRDDHPVTDAWVANVKEVFTSGGTATVAAPRDVGTGGSGTGGFVAPAHWADADSIAAQLERLQALREKGTLTEDEFQQAKKKILS
jgi:uncharacterized RDD family membrane protein YckC